jgi:transcriptional regulator with AAA-type ATPase domain
LGEARLIDRRRLAVLLQAAGLLSVLERAGWRIADWTAARVTPDGRLTVDGAEPGRPRPAQEVLCELLDRLFGVAPAEGEGGGRLAGRLAGKGGARQAARPLLASWRQVLVPIAADDAVGHILDAAPFLWETAYAAARTALAGEMRISEEGDGRGGERAVLAVAGPPAFRRRLLASVLAPADLRSLRELLAGPAARALWEGIEEGDPRELTAARRWRAAAAAWARHPPRLEEDCVAFARALAALGRFETALTALAGTKSAAARILRAECQAQMGQLGAAWTSLAALRKASLAPDDAIELAETASRVLANRGGSRRIGRWLRNSLATAAGDPRTAPRAHLVAALAAWDRRQRPAMQRALEEARPGVLGSGDPDLAWRWHHARALLAMREGDGAVATEHAAHALRLGRRWLPRHRAASLWNDLGLGRALTGDLAGAERAFLHSHRLFLGCDGPRKTTLALYNLAEIRLRRGRLAGVREILERSTAENRQAGNLRGLTQDLELQARWELAAGRSEAALVLCRDALAELTRHGLDWRRDELRLLSARALGWLGRTDEAAAALDGLPPAVLLELEPEERPAVLVLAGRRRGAQRAAGALADPGLRALWKALLTARTAQKTRRAPGAVAPALWRGALERLEPYRAARLVYDAERILPGAAPPGVRRAAAATLREAGAATLALSLEALEQAREPAERSAPWRALAAYCSRAPGDPEALTALFASAGYPAHCPGAGPVTAADCSAADPADPVLGALLALAARDLAAMASPGAAVPWAADGGERSGRALRASAGMVGESPGLRAAVERLDRLAARDLPILILGESGTGKELAARRVHRASPRVRAPFLAVNCAALSETLILSDLFGHARGAFTGADRERAGVFQAADGGTVFLDEIGDLPLSAQAMLLRVLQEGEVRRLGESEPRRIDVRVLAATHRDLAAMVAAKTFRQDLYFRLKVGIIELPPLRDRGNDVLLLAESFLSRPGGPSGARLANEARACLLAYSWPGNVRELENILRVAAALAGNDPIQPEHLELPGIERPSATFYHSEVDALRRRLIASALAACSGNLSAAAQSLGMSRQGLSYLRRQLGIG